MMSISKKLFTKTPEGTLVNMRLLKSFLSVLGKQKHNSNLYNVIVQYYFNINELVVYV